jgi:hypothetical protein
MLRRTVFTLTVAALACWAAPTTAEAGVIVLKNGEVLLGKIRKDDVTKEQITMHFREGNERGEIEIPRFRIRWFDAEADGPTDLYWETFGGKPIQGSRWAKEYEEWKLRKRARADALEGDFLLSAETLLSKARLSPIPVENGNIKIQKPEGWSSSIDEDGITIFVADKAGTEGFRPRIHVFAVKAASGQAVDQIEWVEKEVGRLAGKAGTFEVRERKRLHIRAGGSDQEMVTLTRRLDRPVVTLRKMLFRKKNSYFFSAYAHERDYQGLESLFKDCMRSLELREDTKAKKRRP